MKKFFLFAAVALLALVGCEKQTQSGIKLNDVKGEALVKGRLIDYFNEPGKETAPVNFAGVRVYVTVKAGDFVNDGAGNIVFNDTTDADGYFEIPVKVGAKEMTATINTESFFVKQGDRKIYYEAIHQDLVNPLNAGDVYDVTSELSLKKDVILNSTVGDATVKGTLKYNVGVPTEGKGIENIVPATKGEQVVAIVKYSTGDRRFFLTVGDKGVFEGAIPVEENGNDFDIEVPQNFRKIGVLNSKGKRIEVNASFKYAAAYAGRLNAGELTTVDPNPIVLEGEPDEITTKNTKFTVKGKIQLAAETLTYSKTDKTNDGDYSKIDGVEKGAKAYTTSSNGGKFHLRIKYSGEKEGQINYDLTVADAKGNYSQEVAIYDNWELDKVTLEIYVDEFAVDNFVHYYYNHWYKDDNDKWKENKNGWCKWSKSQGIEENFTQSQKCVGVYGQEDRIASGKPNKFFDVTIDAVIPFRMTSASKKALRGLGNEVDFEDGKEKYAGGQDFFPTL